MFVVLLNELFFNCVEYVQMLTQWEREMVVKEIRKWEHLLQLSDFMPRCWHV